MPSTDSMREALRSGLTGSDDGLTQQDELAHRVFRDLLQAIVTLEYEPGRIVSQSELLEATSGSRTALRQAVAALSDLGLMTALARKGFLVAPLDVFDVSTVYDARWAIESRLARFAALRTTDEQVESLVALTEAKSVDGTSELTATEFIQRDQALHLAIASAARNRFLEDALTRILPISARLWHRLYRELGTDRRFMFHHNGIVEAVAGRDPDAAERAVADHLNAARDVLSSMFLPASEAGT